DDVSAKITASEIIVSNDSDEPVYVFAVGKTIQPLILWAPSLQDEQRVGAHQKRTFARDASVIADKESRATVYWWVSVVKNGVAEPGPIQSFDVSVP
nr:hypothetical protein [Calditrichia bacterium]